MRNAAARGPVFSPRDLTSPSPAPSPSPLSDGHGSLLQFPAFPVLDSAFDVVTLSLIASLIIFSLVSLVFILQLRLKSRTSHHLQGFNSLWFVRLLFTAFVAASAFSEILRLPSFHRSHRLSQQANLCKFHVVLSLGFFQPGFLISLLFLLNVSIKNRNTNNQWAIGVIFLLCLPVLVLQAFFVFFSPLEANVPYVFFSSSLFSIDSFHHKSLLCIYPLFSTIVFAGFGITLSLCFLFSYWRVVSLVINKGTSFRIHALAFSILISLPMQVIFLAFSSFFRPEEAIYSCFMLGKFVCVLCCATVGESVLVIKPITDALSAGGDCCQWDASVTPRPMEVE
ncbi:uncharacterized protein LOC127794480 [Diospyros lotus]|uniref:uncharacterized protein LOC127794480 n=1 Tax=Diospyros lotus TaxID=55363 RepID=UPI0022576C92|nr:uncharacterized protein LOC127794480 [Diospyros lotus]